jgi:hypothetical protein
MLYDHCSRKILTEDPAAAPALRKAVESGSGAAAILLLGNFRDVESIRTLRSIPTVKPVKLHLSSVPAPAPLAAAVALAHAGDPQPLELAVRTTNLAEAEFLLDALGEIEPGPAMRTLAVSALDDHREVAGGVPSGPRAPAPPVRCGGGCLRRPAEAGTRISPHAVAPLPAGTNSQSPRSHPGTSAPLNAYDGAQIRMRVGFDGRQDLTFN